MFMYDTISSDKFDHNLDLDISQSYDLSGWNIQPISPYW